MTETLQQLVAKQAAKDRWQQAEYSDQLELKFQQLIPKSPTDAKNRQPDTEDRNCLCHMSHLQNCAEDYRRLSEMCAHLLIAALGHGTSPVTLWVTERWRLKIAYMENLD